MSSLRGPALCSPLVEKRLRHMVKESFSASRTDPMRDRRSFYPLFFAIKFPGLNAPADIPGIASGASRDPKGWFWNFFHRIDRFEEIRM